MSRQLRLMYAAGPGNIIGTYRHWIKGTEDPSQISITYSSQFFEVCRSLNCQALVISSFAPAESLQDGRFQLRNMPVGFSGATGPFYHVAIVLYGLRLLAAAVSFRADYLVIADGSTHWFLFYLLPRSRYRVIPTIHCPLWPLGMAPKAHKPLRQIWRRSMGWLFRRHAHAILSASSDVTDQIKEVASGGARPIVSFLPSYRRDTFASAGAPPATPPFRVLFAGRIVQAKGVFTLLDAARILNTAGEEQIEFDICGEGEDLAQLRKEAALAGLSASFRCHGHCKRSVMSEMFKRCQVAIVPTTTAFGEGFNQVIVESVLAGRPVIASISCPARRYVSAAVIEVPTDDPRDYAKAILDLSKNPDQYQLMRAACVQYENLFYDQRKGWGAALRGIVRPQEGAPHWEQSS